ncbi:MAG TPA: NADH-quinone oxidoreductase subunit C [Chloroflexota bacterium]|nr:NADH-quinone oxidoreductase subunit C [Chloroflexota bacterium]
MASSQTPPDNPGGEPAPPEQAGPPAPPSGEPARSAPPPAGEPAGAEPQAAGTTPPAPVTPGGAESEVAAPPNAGAQPTPAAAPSGPAPEGQAAAPSAEGAPTAPARPARPAPAGEGAATPEGAPSERPARPARPAAGEGAPPAEAAPAAERPARPAPAGAGAAATGAAPARPARPAARAQQPAAPPPPDEKALAHPISKALAPMAPNIDSRFVHGYLEMVIPAERLLESARILREQFDYDYLSQVTAVDWPDRFEVVYTLYHLANWQQRLADDPEGPKGIMLRVSLPRVEEPRVISLVSVWPGADLQEREVYDMFGIRFVGHPDLRRILLDDDFPGFPLRKDFTLDPEYVLVRHLARGVEGQLDYIDAGDSQA